MTASEAGAALRSARRSLAISVAKASQLAGVSASTVKRWELGQGLPTWREVELYLDSIGTPPDCVHRVAEGAKGLRAESAPERPLLRILRAKRRRQMLTLEELSASTGLSVATLHRYETGERIPDAATLRQLAQIYGCEASEIDMLSGEVAAPEPDGSLIQRFVEPGKQPHLWLYRQLESSTRPSAKLTPERALDLIHCLMIMGDHRGVLEAWTLLRPRTHGLPFSADQKAEIGMSLIMARFTVSRDARAARDRISKWRDYAVEAKSARAMSHLARLAAALGETYEAELWIDRLQDQAERTSDSGHMFVCSVNRLMLSFDRTPSVSVLDSLDYVRAHAVGPLQKYTGDVCALYMLDRLQDRAADKVLERCSADERAYGFGSPLAASIRRRRSRRHSA
jgi:transcriptional regulator with XRE-family HTH domain